MAGDLPGSEPVAAPTDGGPDLADAALRYGPELLRRARRVLGDRARAEDAVQETLARAWRARESFDPARGSLRTWLFGIERNLLVDTARHRARGPGDEVTLELVDDPAAPDAGDPVDPTWLVGVLDALGPLHRAVVVDVCLAGWTCAEVARRSGVPEGTVRSRLHYALATLRDQLDREEVR
jgi:RNA polymerase sigma-70 factor (ECF subfamily)